MAAESTRVVVDYYDARAPRWHGPVEAVEQSRKRAAAEIERMPKGGIRRVSIETVPDHQIIFTRGAG